jgi:UDP-galactopyranose mutase
MKIQSEPTTNGSKQCGIRILMQETENEKKQQRQNSARPDKLKQTARNLNSCIYLGYTEKSWNDEIAKNADHFRKLKTL